MKTLPTDEPTFKVVIELPGKKKQQFLVPKKHWPKVEASLEKYSQSEFAMESTPWNTLAKNRVAKFKKAGLALRGARFREGLSQKELGNRCGITQDNISKMETGKRPIGEKVAKKLAKVLDIDFKLLTDV